MNQKEITSPYMQPNYPHADTKKELVGEGRDAVWIFTPKSPVPALAPLIVFLHGYRATEPYVYGGWIDHLVRSGNIVVFPVYEETRRDTDQQNIDAAINGIKLAVTILQNRGPVQPDTSKFAFLGHSFGGGLSFVLAAKAQSTGLPIAKVIMAVQPGWKGGGKYPMAELDHVSASVMILIVDGSEDQFADTREGENIYRQTRQISDSQKAYIVLQSDSHNGSRLLADHYAPLSPREDYKSKVRRRGVLRRMIVKSLLDIRDGEVDELDRFGFWPLFDALLAAGFAGENDKSIDRVIENAGGENMGTWPDGTRRKPRLIKRNSHE